MNSTADQPTNPVVKETVLRSVPGWKVREYEDGTFDATRLHGDGLTWGCTEFRFAVAAARYLEGGEQGDITKVPGFLRED